MKNNSELQKVVQKAIYWKSAMRPAEIGVAVKAGVVMLSRTADRETKKEYTERALKNVMSVKAMAAEFIVAYRRSFKINDRLHAIDVLNACYNNWEVHMKEISKRVKDFLGNARK